MHDIEPYYKWREYYIASEDSDSPFHGKAYDEFTFTNKIYNYFIHPQWDDFGSQTLYMKILFVDYAEGFAMIEMIGEWNDCINNDIMFLKREIVDHLLRKGIDKFIIFCDNILNFHGDDDSYYEEWYEDINETGGWISFINLQDHVLQEMENFRLQYYINLGPNLSNIHWRYKTPAMAIRHVIEIMNSSVKQLRY
ncbi:MAG: hypothetical protein P1U56_00365 [Saprospiraceae bacterium]|nr:hypothetical protein [Saprospiraceae bacterium]